MGPDTLNSTFSMTEDDKQFAKSPNFDEQIRPCEERPAGAEGLGAPSGPRGPKGPTGGPHGGPHGVPPIFPSSLRG